ncbi:MAG TPA: GDP-L-fucose synthase [Burkholderiaceae bacterium]|nr:GDP-L-fucose synthase [Burkholderiaceae bacterium]
MDHATRIYVAGHRGLAGSAIARELASRGYHNVLERNHSALDLEDARATHGFFARERPEIVFLAAARVGGIVANNSYPVDFLIRNIRIETNVIEAAHVAGVRRLVFLGSSCIYPRECPQPIREEYLLTGPLEATNRPYALAKIAGIECCWSYNRQYGTRFLAAMPTNLYGRGDNYDLQNSHVLPALIRKMHEAMVAGAREVTIWGSGSPRREFLHADDLARALVFLAELDDATFGRLTDPASCPLINIGTGEDMTIAELAQMVAKIVGFEGTFVYDRTRPDGTPRKVLDVSRMRALGWRPEVSLHDGIKAAYRDFLEGESQGQNAG